MEIYILRKKLNAYINQADEKTLEALYNLLKSDDSLKSFNYWEDPDFLAKLEEGVEEYEQKRSKLKTWETISRELQ